jgi:hypothetical protein
MARPEAGAGGECQVETLGQQGQDGLVPRDLAAGHGEGPPLKPDSPMRSR